MEKSEIFEILRFARLYSAEQLPWFSLILFRCNIRLTNQVPVAAISENLDIFFNTEAVESIWRFSDKKQALAELGFLWVHEVSHILREHAERARELKADPELWNIAADCEINDNDWEGLRSPSLFPGCFPEKFGLPDGQLAEFYYSKLLSNRKPNKIKNSFENDEGSGVHGEKRSWEIENEKNSSISSMEIEHIRREVAKSIKQSAGIEKGSTIGMWKRWAENTLQSKINWRKTLKRRLRTVLVQQTGGKIDYTFKRPNRRQSIYHPVITPSLYGSFESRIACVVDTSGSMTSQHLNQAFAEVLKVLLQFKLPITVHPCDAIAFDPITISSKSDYIKLQELPGGGGTNMIAGIETAMAQNPKPDIVLVLTDGYTNYPDKPYKIPVIFGIIIIDELWYTPPLPDCPPWEDSSIIRISVSSIDQLQKGETT